MRKHVVFGLFAIMAAASAAHATDNNHDRDHDRDRLFRFNFLCDFDRDHDHDLTANASSVLDPMDDPADGQGDGHDHERGCDAAATVFARVDGDSWGSNMTMLGDHMNRLAVACQGRLIYSDGANLESGHRFVEIEGLNGSPAIFVERRHDDHLSAEWMKYKAFLVLRDGFRIRGECKVKAEPVWDVNSTNTSPTTTP